MGRPIFSFVFSGLLLIAKPCGDRSYRHFIISTRMIFRLMNLMTKPMCHANEADSTQCNWMLHETRKIKARKRWERAAYSLYGRPFNYCVLTIKRTPKNIAGNLSAIRIYIYIYGDVACIATVIEWIGCYVQIKIVRGWRMHVFRAKSYIRSWKY